MVTIAPDARIGRVLDARYCLLALVGVGAYGRVYLADDRNLRRQVAVKVLHPALARDRRFLARFEAEAHAAAAVTHPHLLRVYDSGTSSDGPYIVTEYLGGGTLRSMMDVHGTITVPQALRIGFEAAAGLHSAHRHGLIHRDLKPANLLFDESGRVRVADFGLAKAQMEAGLTEPHQVVAGTIRYMPPETGSPKGLTGKADVFSLALSLVESVTGEVPLSDAGTPVELLELRRSNSIVLDGRWSAARGVMEAALARVPEQRPTAREMAEGIRAAAASFPQPGPLPLVSTTADALIDLSDRTTVDSPRQRHRVSETVSPSPAVADPDQPRRRRFRRARLALAGLAVVAAVVVGWLLISEDPPVMPDLAGTEAAAAEATVADLGWEVLVDEAHHPEVPEGSVIRTVPGPGEGLGSAEAATIVVSLGPQPVAVPEVVAVPTEAATASLEDAGFVVADQPSEWSEEVPADHVVRIELAADGTVVDPGADRFLGEELVVVVSRGPLPREVPELVGIPREEAEARLAAEQLRPLVREEHSDEVGAGTVMSASMEAGSEVARDSEVEIVVSLGPDLRTVPAIIGKTLEDARASLEAQGLRVGRITRVRSGANKVYETGTGQEPGTRHRPGTEIDLALF